MAKTTPTTQEQIVREGKVQTRPSIFWDQGLATLTTQRFYFQARAGTWLRSFGLLGTLVRTALPVKVKVDLPLSSISAIGRGRVGVLRDVFFIETRTGNKYQFRSEHELWLEALKDTLQKTGAVLIQTSSERWEA